IAILSHEESRVMASIQAVAERRGRRVVTWMCTQGLQQVRPEDSFNDWHPDSDLAFDPEMIRTEILMPPPRFELGTYLYGYLV
ncbi:MAG: hypothetical protein ABSE06_14970, partial [Anaerolineaceae bacterium]